MSAIAAIHVAKKQLGLDDDTYRALLERETGKSSAKDMSAAERNRVIEALRRQGFKPASKAGGKAARKPLEGRYAPILQALWIAGWNLGIVRDREDSALIAFVKRQAKIDHVRFLHDPADARSAIEGLKGWLKRDGGVDWTVGRFMPDWKQVNGYRIATAQVAILKKRDPAFAAEYPDLQHWLSFTQGPEAFASRFDDDDWRMVMNTLGVQVRKRRS